MLAMDPKDLQSRIFNVAQSVDNFEIQKYYQNESRFNEVYFRDNLPDKIKDGAYVINLDEYSDIGTHWIALYALNNNFTYFDSFGVEHIPKILKHLLVIKAYRQIFLEYKLILDIFVLDLLILWLKVKA